MKKTRNEVAVGAFVLIGIITLSLMVFFVSGVYLFHPGYHITVNYNYVSILDKGAPIRMAGVRIGEVNSVELLYDAEQQRTRVQVKLFIEEGIEIRKNYEFSIQGTHVLSEPHIEITPKEGQSPVLQDGDVLEGVNPVPVEALIENAHDVSAEMKVMVSEIHEGKGTVGSLLFEEELYQDMREFMADIKKHPWKLLKKDDGGKGKKFLFF